MKRLLLAGAAVVALAVGAAPSAEAGVLGSNVSAADFQAAQGEAATNGWSYLGQSTSAFTVGGAGTLELRNAAFRNSFGYSGVGPAYANQAIVFAANAAVNSVAAINPGYSPFVFFFDNNQDGTPDDAIARTDGTEAGPAASQVGIDIFRKGNTYAFFFDDSGGTGVNPNTGLPRDDNDFNDMVVNFTPTAVPEPASLALFGAGLLGLGLARRARRATRA